MNIRKTVIALIDIVITIDTKTPDSTARTSEALCGAI